MQLLLLIYSFWKFSFKLHKLLFDIQSLKYRQHPLTVMSCVQCKRGWVQPPLPIPHSARQRRSSSLKQKQIVHLKYGTKMMRHKDFLEELSPSYLISFMKHTAAHSTAISSTYFFFFSILKRVL